MDSRAKAAAGPAAGPPEGRPGPEGAPVWQRNADSRLEFDEVSKRFWKGDTPMDALLPTSLEIGAGEFVGIVGPSGCGKSTLLNIAAGLLRPTRGEVRYDGSPVTGVNTRVGYITQKDNVLPWRTVARNVALPLEVRKYPRDKRKQRVQELIEMVGLSGFEGHYPAELSGGMRKRVALAAMLVYDPETLLMDEPFGALDAQLKLVLQQQLLEIWRETGKTILFVTHDLAEAIALCDRVVVMSARPGQVKLVQDIDIARPRDLSQVRLDRRFNEIFQTLWATLSEDMYQGDEMLRQSPERKR